MYGDTNTESFIPMRLPRGEVHEATSRPRARWHWPLGEYVGAPYAPSNEEEYDNFLTNDDFDRLDNEVFLDPTQKVDEFANKSTGNIQALRNGSYGYNYHYLGNTRAEGPNGGFANYPVRMSRIQVPFDTVAIADSSGSQFVRVERGARDHAYTADPPRLDTENNRAQSFATSDGPSPAHNRHGGKATVAFLDGHVTMLTLRSLGYIVSDEDLGLVEVDRGSNGKFNGLGFDKDEDH
jgi:prepilin-type processing-associated H-X9-DG protein